MKALRLIGFAVVAALVTVFAATYYFRPRLEKKLADAAMSRLQQDHLRVESIAANWRKLTVRMYGSNPAKVKQVYERLSTTPGVSSVHVETLPVRDPFLTVQNADGKVIVRGLLSNQFLADEIAKWTGQPVQVAPDVREDPLELTVLQLVQQWSKSKSLDSLKLGFDAGRIRLLAEFNNEAALVSTSEILKSQRDGVIEKKLVLNTPPEVPETETQVAESGPEGLSNRQVASTGPRLPRIQFSFASSELSEESQKQITELVNFLKADPNARVRVMGFTDNHGDERFNYYLSKKRAEHVASLLREAGISPKAIIVEGRGPTGFIADNSTLAGRKLNRRVEFALIRKG